MKRNRYFLVLMAVMACVCVSCEDTLDVDDSGANDLLVLNGVPSAGRQAFIYFSHSHFFLDNSSNHPVAGAVPTLTVNGVPYAHDSVSGSKFFFPYTCQPGDSLTIDVTSPSGNVHAKTYVPLVPAISGFSVAEYPTSSFNFYLAQYTLSDHADNPEYYYLKVEVRDSGMRYNDWTHQFDSVDTVHSTYFLMPNNPELTSSDVSPNVALGGYLYTSIMSTDRRIDGQDCDVRLFIMHLKDTNEVVNDTQQFKHWYDITIESITLERLRYLISVSQNLNTVSFFAEPVQPFTNIEGGVGIFGGSSKVKFSFDADTVTTAGGPSGLPVESLEAILGSQRQNVGRRTDRY